MKTFLVQFLILLIARISQSSRFHRGKQLPDSPFNSYNQISNGDNGMLVAIDNTRHFFLYKIFNNIQQTASANLFTTESASYFKNSERLTYSFNVTSPMARLSMFYHIPMTGQHCKSFLSMVMFFDANPIAYWAQSNDNYTLYNSWNMQDVRLTGSAYNIQIGIHTVTIKFLANHSGLMYINYLLSYQFLQNNTMYEFPRPNVTLTIEGEYLNTNFYQIPSSRKKDKTSKANYRKKNSVSKYIDKLFEEEQLEDDSENYVEENAFDSVNRIKNRLNNQFSLFSDDKNKREFKNENELDRSLNLFLNDNKNDLSAELDEDDDSEEIDNSEENDSEDENSIEIDHLEENED